MDLFEKLTNKEQNMLKHALNKLLGSGFILKKLESTKDEYYFLETKRELVRQYLDVLGFDLEINSTLGVIQLVNHEKNMHELFNLHESIILLIIRILYDENKRHLNITDDILITVDDIQQKYLSLKIRGKDKINMTSMRNALRKFQKHNLVLILDKELNHDDSRIIVYDSIAMAIRVEDIMKVTEIINGYKKEGGSDHEEIDESEID